VDKITQVVSTRGMRQWCCAVLLVGVAVGGAAGGATDGVARGILGNRKNDPIFQRCVEQCLRDDGYETIG
jgi:hypothetical protein